MPLPGVDLRIIDENGNDVPADGTTMGELQVRGPWIASGYMGETHSIAMDDKSVDQPHTGATCLRVEYRKADGTKVTAGPGAASGKPASANVGTSGATCSPTWRASTTAVASSCGS